MQDLNDFLQGNDYVILLQPVLVPRQAIQSLSLMPLPVPSQLPQQPMALPPQPMQQSPTPVADEPVLQGGPPTVHPYTTGSPRPSEGWEPATDKQMECILNMARELGLLEEEVCQAAGIEALDQMTSAQANALIREYSQLTRLLLHDAYKMPAQAQFQTV